MEIELAAFFQAVGEALRQSRAALNQMDVYNGNHGDHMVEIFEIVARAAEESSQAELAQAMADAGRLLTQQAHNGSAQLYARGLLCMAEQFRKYDVNLEELLAYVQSSLVEDEEKRARKTSTRSGAVLKALAAGLASWGQAEQVSAASPLNIGALFEFGMAYLQAKQRGGSKIEVLADAAVSVSPLRDTPHRCQSGKIAIEALLRAMRG
ncbi:MAG: hypothetical protein JXA78_02235 [Anaerolineales bacterium]|nr:hypothetical protein [Anaerolineales bacterium]